MEDLKTIKDLAKSHYHLLSWDGKSEFEFIGSSDKDLKLLAITHIKHMRREGRDLYNSNIDEKSAIPKLMEIFNLNDEDLKDG